MNRRLTILLTALSALLSTTLGAQTKGFSLRVMSMNIRQGGEYAGFLAEPFAELINLYKPDVIALQEIDYYTDRNGHRDWFNDVAMQTGMLPYYCKGANYRNGAFGLGLLSRYPFYNGGKIVTVLPDNDEARVSGWIYLMLPDGNTLRVASTHLALATPQQNVRQLADVNKQLFAADTTTPTLLVGDFNADPDSDTINYARIKWQDIGRGTGFTIPTSGPYSRIDYVMGYPKGCWSYTTYEIVCRADLSDHCFIVADVEFTPTE
ncbi:MAG: endonuclease/exonuclease/phosphatase family protein [Tidjanibacter sp.]|nr:endonuclease/exonuclease/phosphatase family protein [Tidjanibacter sp.]